MLWSAAQRVTAALLLKAGKPRAEVARAIGVTRSALNGRLQRDIGLRRAIPTSPNSKPDEPVIPPLHVRAQPQPDRIVVFREPPKREMLPEPPRPPTEGKMLYLPLAVLGRHQCRFAVREDHTVTGYWLFCGLDTEGGTYCPYHARVVGPFGRL